MKIWVFTPSYCKAAVLEGCLQTIYGASIPKIEHVVPDNHYPVDKANNRRRIQELCQEYGCHYIDSGRDLGWAEAVNRAIKSLGVAEDDLLVFCDPDDRPEPGWIEALKDVILADRTIAVACLSFCVIDERKKEGVLTQETIAGHEVLIHPGIEMFNVSAMPASMILRFGGVGQMSPLYGGLETWLYQRFAPLGMRVGYLANVRSDLNAPDRADTSLFDPEYREWKVAHAHHGDPRSFEEWLANPSQFGNVQ